MKTASIAAAAAALFTTMIEARAFTLKLRSGDQYNDVPVVAWNGMFIAELHGNSTTATCPPYNTNCPAKDKTILSGPTVDGEPTQLWMGVLQEHGQRVYTHPPPEGLFESTGYGDLIGYTAAGNDESANVPKVDSFNDLWTIITVDNDDGLYGSVRGDLALAHGPDQRFVFDICPEYDNPWGGETHILNTVSKYCTPVMVVVEFTDVAAPQFYNCNGCELRGDLCNNGPACYPPFCARMNRWI